MTKTAGSLRCRGHIMGRMLRIESLRKELAAKEMYVILNGKLHGLMMEVLHGGSPMRTSDDTKTLVLRRLHLVKCVFLRFGE